MRIAAVFLALLFTTAPAFGYLIRDCRSTAETSTQVSMVADINPGPADARNGIFGVSRHNEYMAAFNGALYFQADDGKSGPELWRVTPGGAPMRVADVVPGPQGSSPHAFVVFHDRLFFAATTPATGEELFVYDGHEVSLMAETVPGSGGAEILSTIVFNNEIYFTRFVLPDITVWRLTGGKVQPVTAINSLAKFGDSALDTSPFVVFKGRLYFVTYKTPFTLDLWAYDGAKATKIKMLTDTQNGVTYHSALAVYGEHLYFTVIVGDQTDELWRYDGQSAPAKVFTLPGDAVSSSQPTDFAVYGGRLYFGQGADRTWRYDGAKVEDVTGLLAGITSTSPYPAANRLFVSSYDGQWEDQEPYLFDGTKATLVKEIMPDEAATPATYPGSFPSRAVEVGDELYFYASDEHHGRELWRIRTTASNVKLDCNIVVAPVWDDWRVWPQRERAVVLSTWLIDARTTRLLSREDLTVTRDTPTRVRTPEIDARQSAALVIVVTDRETGRVLDRTYEILGAPSPRLRRQLQRGAATLIRRGTVN
jgi:ELWxxDGT repeat protein